MLECFVELWYCLFIKCLVIVGVVSMINQSSLLFDRAKKTVGQNSLLLIGVPVFCLIGGLGYYFYSSYTYAEQERSQLAFSQTMEELRHGEKNAELWPNAELAAKAGHRSYKATAFGPYFLVLESQAALAQGNLEAGLKILEDALRQMGSHSPLYSLYKIKAALIKLDVDDAVVQAEGLKELEKLAYDKGNMQRDEALYYLGDYFMNHGQKDKALSVWQELKKEFSSTNVSFASPWVLTADEKTK